MRIVPALAALLLLAGCGESTGTPSPAPEGAPPSPTAVPSADGPVTTGGPVTVLDDGDGAELCLGAVAASYPPQCGGPRVIGWDWTQHRGDFEESRGVRWGEFVVTGEFDGHDLTPSRVVPADEAPPPAPYDGPDFSTSCPEPDGGWVVDPSRVTSSDMDRAFGRAKRLDDYAFSYVDTSADPRTPEQMDEEATAGHDDVSTWVVNVRVTGDPAAAEEALRDVWGGGLCVQQAAHTDAELEKIQLALNGTPGMLGTSRGQDRVDLDVVYDDGSFQSWCDAEYGAGIVRVDSALRPVG